LIIRHQIRFAQLVTSEPEAKTLGLELDHKDDHVYNANRINPFALLLHGTQKAGSKMAKIWEKLRTTGKGYNVKRRKEQELKAA
jgi:hypothetical protein